MRRQAMVTTVMLLVGLLALAPSGVAGAAKQDVDFTKGKGTNSSGGKFNFKAQDLDADPGTIAAEGKFTYKAPIGFTSITKGKVTCLVVDGQNAILSGRIEKSNVPFWEGKFFVVKVFDSGQPNGEGDLFDLTFLDASDPSCATTTGASEPIEKGNIVVNDAV